MTNFATRWEICTNLETLVLQHFLDSHILLIITRLTTRALHQASLKDDAKRAIANDFAVGIGNLTLFTRLSLRRYDLDHLLWVIDTGCGGAGPNEQIWFQRVCRPVDAGSPDARTELLDMVVLVLASA